MKSMGRCVNERCRERGIARSIFVGDWFVDDPILCPLCGELMETVAQVTAAAWYPLGPGWGPVGGWPRPLRGRYK
jgi:hypothetical protein